MRLICPTCGAPVTDDTWQAHRTFCCPHTREGPIEAPTRPKRPQPPATLPMFDDKPAPRAYD